MKEHTSRTKLSQKIAEQLLQEIKDQKYPVGSRLPSERELALRFSVSRPTIRNAIRELESFGCLETKLGAGSYIKASDMRQAAEIFSSTLTNDSVMNCDVVEVRILLDTETVAMAAARRTNAQLQALKENIAEMQHRIEAGLDWIELDEQFHILVAAAANNPILYNLIEICRGIYTYTVRLSADITQTPEISLRQHQELCAAIEIRDTEKARSLARQHLIRTLYQYELNQL